MEVQALEQLLIPNSEISQRLRSCPLEEINAHNLHERRYCAAVILLGLLETADIQQALSYAHNSGEKREFETILFQHPNIDYTARLKAQAYVNSMSFVPLEHYRIDETVIRLLSPELARAHKMVPFRADEPSKEGGPRIVWVLTGRPQDAAGKEAVKQFFSTRPLPYRVEFIAVAPDQLDKVVDSRYTSTAGFEEEEEEKKEEENDETGELGPANEFFARVFARAVELGASDVHIEGDSEAAGGLQVRMRIDGALNLIERVDRRYRSAILSVMKNNLGMDVSERRRSQSGRASKIIQGREIEFRAETLPAIDSEDIVVRILDKGNLTLDLETMGWTDANLKRFRQAYQKPYGAIIVTGPTGSGKTSTLYAVLKDLTKESEKLVTIEDPVEYKLPGLRQVLVDEKIGRSFAASLRSILRSDPDTVMVGEIRDDETARIAMRAANTGHLVLSTLHTNDAASAPITLIQMGIPEYVIADALTVVVAQRLLRRLCPRCRRSYRPSDVEMKSLLVGYKPQQVQQVLQSLGQYPIHQANEKGCADCNKGYSGRLAIHEVLVMGDPEKEILLSPERSSLKLRDSAMERGQMHTLRQDAVYKALEGLTSFEEVRRVTTE